MLVENRNAIVRGGPLLIASMANTKAFDRSDGQENNMPFNSAIHNSDPCIRHPKPRGYRCTRRAPAGKRNDEDAGYCAICSVAPPKPRIVPASCAA